MSTDIAALSLEWLTRSAEKRYSYNFTWLSRPIIQYPQDIQCVQELIWSIQPDLIIETGVAHGGSLILSASMLALLDMCEAINAGKTIDPVQSRRKVIGVDIEIRAHNRAAIEIHPMASRIEMIEGSSIDPQIVARVVARTRDFDRVLVFLDSMHSHDHVLAELRAYAPLVSEGSYCVVFDTVIEDLPEDFYPQHPWNVGNNPKTAVWDFLAQNDCFEIDRSIPEKLLITVAPDGFLKRIR